MGIFAIPLDIAADWIGERRTHRFADDMFLQSVLKIINREIARIVYPASRVYQFSILVEDIEMWCSQCSIRERYFLRFVAQVQPRKLLFVHPLNLMFEIIVGMGVCTVGVDADKLVSGRRVRSNQKHENVCKSRVQATTRIIYYYTILLWITPFASVLSDFSLYIRRNNPENARSVYVFIMSVPLCLVFIGFSYNWEMSVHKDHQGDAREMEW